MSQSSKRNIYHQYYEIISVLQIRKLNFQAGMVPKAAESRRLLPNLETEVSEVDAFEGRDFCRQIGE